MKLRLQAALCTLAITTAATTACDTAPVTDDAPQLSSRSGTVSGDRDLTLQRETEGDDPIELVWDFVDVDVNDRFGDLVVTADGDQIYDAAGTLRCSLHTADAGSGEQLLDVATGEVLYTAIGRWVFDGPVDAQDPDMGQLAYTFQSDRVMAGEEQQALLVASDDFDDTSSMRKVVIASLADGRCGAPGLS